MENQTGEYVKIIQIDGGTEYKPLKEFFHEKCIVHRVTCPYIFEQNGLVERKHTHIVETGFILLA